MNKVSVRFDATQYVRSHFKQPRGTGSWAFGIGSQIIFAPGSQSLTAAKQWLVAHVQTMRNMPRHMVVDVLP